MSGRIKITLSDASPVTIDPIEWPIIAKAETFDGEIECQAMDITVIKVREHEDRRRIVYGSCTSGPGGARKGFRDIYAGYLIEVRPQIEGHGSPQDMRRGFEARDEKLEEQTIRAIRRVGGVVGDDALAAECIADLPAVEL